LKNTGFAAINNRREGLIYYFSFLVWPFGVMLDAVNNWRKPYAKNVIWLFCIFFGFTFIIAEEGGADSDRYAKLFIEYAHSDVSFSLLWHSFYSAGSDSVDIASPIITFLISRLTDNPRILFTIFGLIFGYFYSRNIWYVLERIKGNITIVVFTYIMVFALLVPLWSINGFRMWTAAQIFLYGAMPFLMEGDKKRLIWALTSVLFHFSFSYPLVVLFIYIFFGNRLNIYFYFFIITSFINELNPDFVRSALSFLPDVFQSRITGYTNTDYIQSTKDLNLELNWYVAYAVKGIKWASYIIVVFTFFSCRKVLVERRDLTKLFCFSLLFFGFANIFSLLPSGGRFVLVAELFLFSFFILMITSWPDIKWSFQIQVLCIPLLLLYFIYQIRLGMDFLSLMTICGNPVLAAINPDPFPLITSIKSFF
jgi:hypothetical protein